MAGYTKFSELTEANQTALITAVHPAGIANSSVILQEYILDEDNELDYSASITDGMSAATVTFSELPATTVAIWVELAYTDSGTEPGVHYKRTSGGTEEIKIHAEFADVGNNELFGTYWLPTGGPSIYVTQVTGDSAASFKILGYKTGA